MDVSLVITNYNRSQYLDRAIRSCLDQILLRRTLEVLVVDDCSTDDSHVILKEFENEVRIFHNETNRGVAYSSNVGLHNARGRFWMRVDADDFLNRFACGNMLPILEENGDIPFVYCDHFRVDMRGVKIEKVRLNHDKALYEHGAGVLFRTDQLRDLGGYKENLRNCEDYDLLLRMKRKFGSGFYLPVPLYRYYIHGRNLSLGPDRNVFKAIVEDGHAV